MSHTFNRRLFLAATSVGLINRTYAAENSRQSLQVQVDPETTGGKTPNDFLGFGYETSSVAVKDLFTPDNEALVRLYGNLGREGVVRIGGNTVDFAKWAPNGKAQSSPKSTVVNNTALSNLGGFLRKTNWKLIWNLNLGSGTPEEAADQAEAVKRLVGDRLLCFQIGNEPDLFFNSGHRPAEYNYNAWYSEYKQWSAVLKQRLGEFRLAGPDVAREMSWVDSFAATEHTKVALLTDHYYRAGQRQPAATFENLLHTDKHLQDTLHQLRTLSDQYGLPYRLVEINSFSGGGKPGISDTFASALWALDLMFMLGSFNCAGLNLETGVNQLGFVSSYSPIFDDGKGQLTARPSYYAMLAFALAGRGTRLHLTQSGAVPDCTAYAVRDRQNQVWITLINKNTKVVAEVDLSSTASWSAAQIMHLEAPSFDSKEGTKLGGHQVTSRGDFAGGQSKRIVARRNHFRLDLQPGSAAIIKSDG